ncbi:MAG: protein kinase, partial [Planctomycetaceae bacterium]
RSDDPEETQVKSSDDPEETQVKRSDDSEETQVKSSDDSEETRVELAGAGEHGSPASAVTESHPAFADVSWRKREVTVGRVSKHPDAEYEIGNMLGQGGMGTVYRARQCSIDRMVALKVVKGNEQGTRARSGTNKKFLIEAVLTGALEHPNIVPIYDLGANTGGDLFYTVKEVRGAPWWKTIDEASVEDNLEVLVKVADAIGYAHSRGVVHRDLKPDNVMIGEFGEVIVMDWGLAIPTVEFEKSDISVRRGPAGTPGYMAPEMAVGPWDHIGPASDIYLLGALLFRLVTGRTLRTGKGSSSIMKAVSSNVIDWPEDSDTSQQELLTIARTALATEIRERFASVFEFQNALRGYRSHSESRRLTETALTELQQARLNDDYRTYERAGAGLEEALRLWPDNPLAGRSLVETRHSYAESAFRQGDLELAEGQLDDGEPQHVDLLGRIRAARDERDRQAGRIRRMKQVATGLAAAVFVTVSVSAVLINTARKHEATAKSEAVGRFRESLAAVAELSQLADALGDYPYAQQERQQLLEAVAAYYGRLTAEQSDVPELQYEQLQSLVRLGELSTQIAKYGRARQVFEQVGQQAKAMTAAGSTWGGQAAAACRQQLQIEMLRAQLGLASLNVQTGSSKNTMTDIELVITGLDALPDTDVVQRERADAWFEHGMAAKKQGEYAVAVNSFKQAVAVLAEYSTDDSLIRQATSRSMIGQVCEMTGDYEQAETSIAAAITLWKELEQKSGFKIDYLDGQATSRVDRANLLRVVGLDPLDDYSQAVECFTRLIEHRPGIPRYRNNHATALLGRAWRHLRMGDTGQGLQDAEESVNAFWSIVNR